MTDIAKYDEFRNIVEQFQQKHSAELAEIKAKGVADPILTEQVNKLNTRIGELESTLQSVEKKSSRPFTADLGDDVHRKAFDAYARRADEAELRAMSLTGSSGADGGFLVPTVISDEITKRLVEVSPMRQIAKVRTTSSQNYTHIVNRGGIASAWVADDATRSETGTSTYQQIVVPMGDIMASPAATYAMLEDAFTNLESDIAKDAAEEFARAEAAAFVNGDGSNKPKGFTTYTTALTADSGRAAGTLQHVLSGNGAGVLPANHDKFLDLVYAMKSGHRAGAVWAANGLTLAGMRKIKDTTGNYLWQPSNVAGQPSTFLGHNVVEMADMPDVANNALAVAFGNFEAGYVIADRRSLYALRDPYTKKGFVVFYTSKRVGGCVVDSEAIKFLKISAS